MNTLIQIRRDLEEINRKIEWAQITKTRLLETLRNNPDVFLRELLQEKTNLVWADLENRAKKIVERFKHYWLTDTQIIIELVELILE